MQAFSSAALTTGAAFETRRATFDAMTAALQLRRDEASAGGNERARKLHQSRGQMLPRERIAALLDPGAPFFEIGQLTAADLYDGVPPGATLITGVGRVAGRDCMLIVNDATVKGGTMFGMTTKRHVRAQMFAWQHRLPCITMVQSGGAFLPDLANIFPDDGQGGSVMYNQVKMSSEGIAQIALVFGPSTAGGAYIPALCDELVIVRNQGAMFLGSPQLVYAATGEVVDSEALGGALMHCSVSGVADHLADDDAHALAIARRIVRHLGEPAPLRWTRAVPEEPRHPAAELRGLAEFIEERPAIEQPTIRFHLEEAGLREIELIRYAAIHRHRQVNACIHTGQRQHRGGHQQGREGKRHRILSGAVTGIQHEEIGASLRKRQYLVTIPPGVIVQKRPLSVEQTEHCPLREGPISKQKRLRTVDIDAPHGRRPGEHLDAVHHVGAQRR